MVKEHKPKFDCLDGWIARRLMRRGPEGVSQLLEGTDPVLWAVVAHKWYREPGISRLCRLSRWTEFLKQISPEDYRQMMEVVFADILAESNGDIEGANRFIELAQNPGIDKNYERFVDELIKNSPKTRDVILKLEKRMSVLEKLGLDLCSDYEAGDSKKWDLLSAKIKTLYAFFIGNAELFYRWFRVYVKLQNNKARLKVANVLWDDVNPGFVDVYRNNVRLCQNLYNAVQEAYNTNIELTRESYKEIKRIIDSKYKNIEKYKEMIRTKQLEPFNKK